MDDTFSTLWKKVNLELIPGYSRLSKNCYLALETQLIFAVLSDLILYKLLKFGRKHLNDSLMNLLYNLVKFFLNLLNYNSEEIMINKANWPCTLNLLHDAKIVADEVNHETLCKQEGTNSNYTPPYISHQHYFGMPYGGYPGYFSGFRGTEESSKNNSWSTPIGIAAAVVSMATIYFIGQDWGSINNANDDLERLKSQKEIALLELKEKNVSSRTKKQVERVAEKQEKIFKLVREDAQWGLLTKSGLLSSAITAAGGAFLLASWPITVIGITGGFVSSLSVLFRAGFNTTTSHIKKEAGDLARQVSYLESSNIPDITGLESFKFAVA